MNLYVTLLHFIELAGKDFLKTYVDPDANRTTCELITTKGYPCETHHVTTEDGYILELHRISNGKQQSSTSTTKDTKKKVLYLQHGLLASSAGWVNNLEHQSLGFVAADAGLDVWLGNVRGSKYCLKHTSLTVNDESFWNFTFNEIAKYDLPAAINYVTNVTQQSHVYYAGHCQGNTYGFIEFSENSEWAKSKVKQFHALSPVVWLYHLSSDTLRNLLKTLTDSMTKEDSKYSSFGYAESNYTVDASIMTLGNTNRSRNSVYCANFPVGTSTLNMLHFAQVPTYIYWSRTDFFTASQDFEKLKNSIENNTVVIHEYKGYSHGEFTLGLNTAREIYSTLIDYVKNGNE